MSISYFSFRNFRTHKMNSRLVCVCVVKPFGRKLLIQKGAQRVVLKQWQTVSFFPQTHQMLMPMPMPMRDDFGLRVCHEVYGIRLFVSVFVRCLCVRFLKYSNVHDIVLWHGMACLPSNSNREYTQHWRVLKLLLPFVPMLLQQSNLRQKQKSR